GRDHDHLALLEGDSLVLHVTCHLTADEDHGKATEELFHGSWDEIWMLGELAAVSCVARQEQHDESEKVDNRIQAGEQHDIRHSQDFVTAHLATIDPTVDELG